MTGIRPARPTPPWASQGRGGDPATGGYSVTLPEARRAVLPLYSLMLAIEPCRRPSGADRLAGRKAVADGGHEFTYAQRTRDDRIALGGRGALPLSASRQAR